jgi:hypothetical protein
MITTEDFKKHISKPFGDEMRLYGFKGTGFDYFQETLDLLISVYIVPGRWGGNCTAGFAIHPKRINKNSAGTFDIKKLKHYNYEFKMGLTEQNPGHIWDYANDKATNLKTLSNIITSLKDKAFPVIDQFKATPNILEQFGIDELDDFHYNWTKKTGVTIATSEMRFAWATTLFLEEKNISKARQFAKWGLSKIDEDWFGEVDFERVMSTNNGA